MRRMLTALLLLALIGALWFAEEKAVGSICDSMLDNIEKLKNADSEKAKELIEKTEKEWNKHEGVLEMLTPHESTDEININWAAYKSRIKKGNYTAADYTLDEMEQRFKELRERMKVSIENIF